MKQFIREIEEHVNLYRDDKSGIAWIEDGRIGLGISVHSNIDSSGSISGMKARGYWGKHDRTIRSHGWIYNIDSFVCGKDNKLEMIVAGECRCQGCIERRMKKAIIEIAEEYKEKIPTRLYKALLAWEPILRGGNYSEI